MAEQPSSALAMRTACFSTEHIEAVARQTGFVQRTSTMTGTLLLALITFGVWSDAKTTLAPLAATGPPGSPHVTGSPAAIDPRLTKRALTFLQELMRRAFAQRPSCQAGDAEHLLTPFARGHIAESTGFALPDSLKDPCPGAGGSAAPAGATLPLVWDDKSSVFPHLARTPWHLPEQKDIDTGVTFARRDDVFLFDGGYVKITALARIADAQAYLGCRLNHQTPLVEVVADGVVPVELAPFLTTVASPMGQTPSLLGVTAQVASRLSAARVPEAVVKARRRRARQTAQKKGYPPSHAHLALRAWNLLITHGPPTIWQPPTILWGSPIRWQVELLLKSWKSSLHVATLNTTTADPTVCDLDGRMLLLRLNYALCPQRRATRWLKRRRELSLLNLVRHFQAGAERWMPALFQAEIALRGLLQRACATAERLVLKASRKRCTTAQRLRESLTTQNEAVACVEAVNA